MDNEFAFGEEKAIRVGLKRRIDHLLLLLFTELGQLVNILPSVGALGHTEGEVELELGEHLPAEEVLFDKGQVCQRLVPIHIRKLKVQLKVAQLEESPRERVP